MADNKRSIRLKDWWKKKKEDETGGIDLQKVVDQILSFSQKITKTTLYDYQKPFARRIIESIVYNEGAEVTGEWPRQTGKTFSIITILSGCAILLPILAQALSQVGLLQIYSKGLWIGIFAPTDDQADTPFNIADKYFKTEEIVSLLATPDFGLEAHKSENVISLSHGSLFRKHSLDQRSKIESKTYHVIWVDEAQSANSIKVRKEVHPMASSTNGTRIKTGVAGTEKCDFLDAINRNKRIKLSNVGAKQNHFTINYKTASKQNSRYAKYVKGEIEKYGPDSEEFRRNYELHWDLEVGMFIPENRFEDLVIKSDIIRQSRDITIGGLDIVKNPDSTVLTIIGELPIHMQDFKVNDWNLEIINKDESNQLKKWRIYNWLEIHGDDHESQFIQIIEFIKNYPNLTRIVMDATGEGDPIFARLRSLFENSKIDVVPYKFNITSKSDLYKNFDGMIRRGQIVWPGSIGARNTKEFRRFMQQMTDMEKKWKGQYLVCNHPDVKGGHDDFCDALGLSLWGTTEDLMPEVEMGWQNVNPLFSRNRDKFNTLVDNRQYTDTRRFNPTLWR